jgi:hypothetical protein
LYCCTSKASKLSTRRRLSRRYLYFCTSKASKLRTSRRLPRLAALAIHILKANVVKMTRHVGVLPQCCRGCRGCRRAAVRFSFFCQYKYTYICMYVCMYVCIYVCMYVCMYVYVSVERYMYVCMYVCLYVCIPGRGGYVYIYICIHIYMYVYLGVEDGVSFESRHFFIRQHTSAYVSIRPPQPGIHTCRLSAGISSYVSIRQHTSGYVSIRPPHPGIHTCRLRAGISSSSFLSCQPRADIWRLQ